MSKGRGAFRTMIAAVAQLLSSTEDSGDGFRPPDVEEHRPLRGLVTDPRAQSTFTRISRFVPHAAPAVDHRVNYDTILHAGVSTFLLS